VNQPATLSDLQEGRLGFDVENTHHLNAREQNIGITGWKRAHSDFASLEIEARKKDRIQVSDKRRQISRNALLSAIYSR
jgi:hypothetical protein